ncbi:hypothetical protein [Cetobacterium sp.]|uniref:hypothetical protein n=1 Tax=Cetobacterium sp. TaxID=2071632 RepID=UPI003F66A053
MIETGVGAKMNVIPGVSDVNQYGTLLEHMNNFYFMYSGLGQLTMSGGAQKTSAETSMSTSQTTETIRLKISNRKRAIEELLAKIFHFYGLMDYNKE